MVEHGQSVVLETAAGIDRAHPPVGVNRHDIGTHIRHAAFAAVHLDQGVGVVARSTQESPRTVILERPSQHPHAVRRERGADRVAAIAAQRLALEGELDRLTAIDALACDGRQAPHAARSARTRAPGW